MDSNFNKLVGVKMSDKELAYIKARAASMGRTSISAYLRWLIAMDREKTKSEETRDRGHRAAVTAP